MDLAEEARPVRHVVVCQRAQDDIHRPALDPVERFIERVNAELSLVADACPGEIDHRR